jgi:predicted nucleic acid-binding protein
MDLSLLDTDVVSEILRGRNKKVTVQASRYRRQFGQLTLSTLSVLEIVAGLARHKREEGIAKFLRFALTEQVISLDTESAEIAGRIHGSLQAQGLSIGVVDPMIAAVAIRNGLVLATGNTAHYSRVQQLGFGLRLVDWRV